MAVSVTCEEIIREPGGRILVRFVGGYELEFTNLEAAKDWVRSLDDNDGVGKQMAYRLFVRKYLHADPTGTNTAQAAGRRLIFDLSSATPIRWDQT